MKFALTAAALATLLSQSVAQTSNGLIINSLQNVVVCQPILISWSGGAPPYYITLVSGTDQTQIIEQLATATNDQSLTWTVNQPVGTSLLLRNAYPGAFLALVIRQLVNR